MKKRLSLFYHLKASIWRAISLSTILLVVPVVLWGQNPSSSPGVVHAKGKVVDSEGETLIGVGVALRNTQRGVVTDTKGEFDLVIPQSVQNPVLVFTYVGKKPVSVPFTGQYLTVRMEDNNQIKEVVVTGIFNKPKESYTGAATMVTARELEDAGNRSLASSLQNVVAGFSISDNNLAGSNPNIMPYISIRGTTTMASELTGLKSDTEALGKANTPLIVLNGFEISLTRFADLDENQVENITVLKDASATAMYGSKGSNGVIVVTTKKPQTGKLRLTYKGTLYVQAADLNSYNLMNSREKVEYEKFAGLYTSTDAIYQEELLEIYNNRRMDVERGVDTYWIKFPVRNSVGSRHSLNFEGGEGSVRYSAGLSYKNYEAPMKGNSRNTFNGNLYLQYDIKNLSFENRLEITSVKGYESPYGNFSEYAAMNSYFTPYDENGIPKLVLEDYAYQNITLITSRRNKVYNPLYNATLPSKDQEEYNEIDNNFAMEWNILPELFVRGKLGITSLKGRRDVYKSAGHTDFADYTEAEHERKGTYVYSPRESQSWETLITVNYSKIFKDKHSLFAGFGFNANESRNESYKIEAEGLSILNMDFLGMAGKYREGGSPSGSESTIRRAGYIFNTTYTYDNRYVMDLSGKYEGSSSSGKNNRFTPFWSAAAGWNLHNEEFIRAFDWINYARIKVSYGVTGATVSSAYQALRTYATKSGISYQGWYGVFLNSWGNPDLKMEKTGQFNIGTEWELLNRRIKLTFDVYNKSTRDAILPVDIPNSSGFSSYHANVGEVSNKGFDLSASFTPVLNRKKDFRIDIGGIMSHNKNRLLKISNSLESLIGSVSGSDVENPAILYEENRSVNTIWAVRSKGIDPATGQEIYVKRDGTETFTWNAADRVACGTKDAELEGSFHIMARYSGFNLTAYFGYRLGGQAYNSSLAARVENITPYNNADRRALYDRWKTPGDKALYKAITDLSVTRVTSRFVMDNNIFQLSTINFGYDVPQLWSREKLGIPYISFKASLEDVFYSSTIKRERGLNSPFSRQFSFSMSLRF